MLRPRADMERIAEAFAHVLRRCDEEGVALILLSGANPSGGLPLRGLIQRRGDTLSAVVEERIASRSDVIRAYNWPDRELARPAYWSADRLHMNERGHHRVAARVLETLDLEPPADWWALPVADAAHLGGAAYYREHVLPWVRRRLTGRSSGDGRIAKYPDWVDIAPTTRASA